MSQLPSLLRDFKSSTIWGQSAIAGSTRSPTTNSIHQIHIEYDTLMSQQRDANDYQLSAAMRLISSLSSSMATFHTAHLPTHNEESTQHRAGMPRSLFAYMCTQIENTKELEDVINALNFLKFTDVAERLAYLHKVAKEEDESVVLESLRDFASFVVREHKLPPPEIGINPDGLLQAIWRKPKYGTLAMNFLPSGDIMFAVVSYQQMSGTQMHRINGVQPPHRVMHHVERFIDGLMHDAQRTL